ncbi:hypothetical protein [Kitasatospora sp. P5_F3]
MLNADREIVQPLLAPGETLIEAAKVSLAPGIARPPEALLTPRQASQLEQKLAKPFNVLRRAYAVVNPVSAAVGAVEDRVASAAPERALHGTGMGGDWASAAGRFVIRMHEDGAYASGLLTVTDRRVLMVVDRSALWQLLTEQHAVQWAVPRGELAEFRRNAKGVLQRGRIDLVFRDGSWAGVTTDLPRNADPLVAAFSG